MVDKIARSIKILQEDGPFDLAKKAISHLYYYPQQMTFDYQQWLVKYHFSNNNIITDDQLPHFSDHIWYINNESSIKYTDPTEDRAPTDLAHYNSMSYIDQRIVCEIPSCQIVGNSCVGFTDENKLVLATASGNKSTLVRRHPLILGSINTKCIISKSYLDSPIQKLNSFSYYFPLVPFYNHYYYHWIVEYLPKLRALEKYEKETNIEPIILIPANPASFVTESLELMGYKSNRWSEWKPDEKLVGNLIVTNHRIHSNKSGFFHSLDDYNWIRDRVTSKAITTPKKNRKIYISRQKADRGRKIVNYEPVVDELKKRGFEPLVMESLSFAEQIRIMMESEVVMGPHGAGLVNLIFSDNAKIIELLPDDVLRPHFCMLSEILNFEYNSLIVETNDQNNMIVDINQLCSLLDKANL